MEIVLIPGLWLDGSSWDSVVPILDRAGHRTHALTLPGMTRDATDRSSITLRDHIDKVIKVVDSLEPAAGKVVLVGHSGGGAVAHGVADARPDRVARVVYVASEPVGDGGFINDGFTSRDGEIPLPDWSEFDEEMLIDLDDRLRTEFRERAVPSPVRVATDRQRLTDQRRYQVPITVIACEYPSTMLRQWVEQGQSGAQELGRIHDVEYVDLPTGHWPQFTKPGELGQLILASVGSA